eukprot:Clim_evm35s202 gene=Clim_evmTU35s202
MSRRWQPLSGDDEDKGIKMTDLEPGRANQDGDDDFGLDPVEQYQSAMPAFPMEESWAGITVSKRNFRCLVLLAVLSFTLSGILVLHAIFSPGSTAIEGGAVNGTFAGKKPRNIIFMVSDGMGPAQVGLGRALQVWDREIEFDIPFHEGENGEDLDAGKEIDNSDPRDAVYRERLAKQKDKHEQRMKAWKEEKAKQPELYSENGNHGSSRLDLTLDSILTGSIRTRSASSFVTDSAAGGTSYSCGQRTHNRYIAVTPDGKPCPTIMEAAKRAGYRTGVIVTSRLTDATPATFTSHARDREMERLIAQQQVALKPDILLGGGLDKYEKWEGEKLCPSDNNHPLQDALDAGYQYVQNKDELSKITTINEKPLLGLFADGHIPFAIDLPENLPALKDMVEKGLELLTAATKDSQKGFFLMVEGSRIDMACHRKDAAGCGREVLAYDATMKAVKDYIDKHPDTLVISTSDHETGGLSLAYQWTPEYPEYKIDLKRYVYVDLSLEKAIEILANGLPKDPQERSEFEESMDMARRREPKDKSKRIGYKNKDLEGIVRRLGLAEFMWDEEEFDTWSVLSQNIFKDDGQSASNIIFTDAMYTKVAKSAGIGYTTHGHTAVDVNLYAYGAGAQNVAGNMYNYELGQLLQTLDDDFDMDAVAKQLAEDGIDTNQPHCASNVPHV